MTDDRSEPVPVVDEALEAAIDRFAEAVIYRSDCESPYVSGADSEVRESRQALLAISARVEEWRPIEEAPKDGAEVIGLSVHEYGDGASFVYGPWTVAFHGGKWRSSWDGAQVLEYMSDFGSEYKQPDCEPTHFRPLPSPPIEK